MITAIRKIIRKFLGKYYKFEKKVDLFFLILLLTSTSYSIIFLKNNNQNFFLANILYVFGFFVIIIKLYSKSVSNQRLQILDLICTLNYHEKLKGAEIGVLFGDYSKTILERINHNKCIIEKLYLIDEWKVSNDYTHGERERGGGGAC